MPSPNPSQGEGDKRGEEKEEAPARVEAATRA